MNLVVHRSVPSSKVAEIIPRGYRGVLTAIKLPDRELDIVVFPEKRPTLGSHAKKGLALIGETTNPILAVGRSFTEEAREQLDAANAIVCTFGSSRWTDQRWLQRGAMKRLDVSLPAEGRVMTHVLFVCSQNKLRSPTAEQIFCDLPGFEVASAGTNRSAAVPLSVELVQWADVIFVMELPHRNIVQKKYRPYLKAKRIVCLDIPDNYGFMDSDLVNLLKRKLGGFFPKK